jgi:hypothetical protein
MQASASPSPWGTSAPRSSSSQRRPSSVSGAFGDAVAPFATLFSTLALGLAVYAAVMQRQELALQRTESEDNRAEQEGQRLAMEAQTLALNRTAIAQERQSVEERRRLEAHRVERALTFYTKASECHDALAWIFSGPIVHSQVMASELRGITLPAPAMGAPPGLVSVCSDVRESLRVLRNCVAAVVRDKSYRGEAVAAAEECERLLGALETELKDASIALGSTTAKLGEGVPSTDAS